MEETFLRISNQFNRLSIDRNSNHFKSVYNSAQNLNSFAYIALLAVAISAIKSNSHISFRAISSLKRLA